MEERYVPKAGQYGGRLLWWNLGRHWPIKTSLAYGGQCQSGRRNTDRRGKDREGLGLRYIISSLDFSLMG